MGQGLEVANLTSSAKLAIGPAGAAVSGWGGSPGGVTIFGPNGQPASPINGGAIVPLTQPLVMIGAGDYKLSRLARCSPDGTLRAGDDMPLFYDSTEGAAVDTNKWVQTTTTMTITQTAATGILFNAGSSVATTVGAMHTTHRRFAFIGRNAMAFRCKARATAHQNNNLIELGFADPPAAATTAAVPNGAFWRKDGTGQWVPVVTVASSEVLGTPISNTFFTTNVGTAVAVTDYCYFSIFLEESRATFRIITTAGAIVTEQVVEFGSTIGTFSSTHLQGFLRTYNSAATGATAVQLFVAQTSIWQVDSFPCTWEEAMVGMNYGSLTSPTAFTQLANYANSAAPTSATLSNTAAGYTTLGGQWQFAAVAGAETDFALFGFQVPAPYALRVKGVRIGAFNMGAAVATTPTLLQWGLGFNSSAVSLATGAPYAPMRKVIGSQSFAVGAAVGANAPDIQWNGNEVVQPGRFFHVILKMPVGTATASQIVRGVCTVDGYFE